MNGLILMKPPVQRDFARILRLPTTQVMCIIQYIPEGKTTVLSVVFEVGNRNRVTLNRPFTGETQTEDAYAALEAITDKECAILLKHTVEQMYQQEANAAKGVVPGVS